MTLRHSKPWHGSMLAHMHCAECGALLKHDPEAEPWAYCPPCRETFTEGVGVPVIAWPSADPTALGIRVGAIDWSQPIPDPPTTRGHGVGRPKSLPRQTEEDYHRCPTCGSANTEHAGTGGANNDAYRRCRMCQQRYCVERTDA